VATYVDRDIFTRAGHPGAIVYHSDNDLIETRMVQLPATAAIEYVAACCRTRTKTKTVRGLMPVPPTSMRIRTV